MPPKASVKGNQLDIENIAGHLLQRDEFKVFICDLLYPINKGKYIQLSEPDGSWDEDEDPENKFPGTSWEQIFDDEGTFFKTEGYLDSNLNPTTEPTHFYRDNQLVAYRGSNGLAEDKSQRRIGHASAYNWRNVGYYNDWDFSGVFTITNRTEAGNGASSYNTRFQLNYDSKLSPGSRVTVDTNDRLEPVNRLMKVFLRKG